MTNARAECYEERPIDRAYNAKACHKQPTLAGNLHKYDFAQADNVWSINGVCPTILAHNAGQVGHQINILEECEDV